MLMVALGELQEIIAQTGASIVRKKSQKWCLCLLKLLQTWKKEVRVDDDTEESSKKTS